MVIDENKINTDNFNKCYDLLIREMFRGDATIECKAITHKYNLLDNKGFDACHKHSLRRMNGLEAIRSCVNIN